MNRFFYLIFIFSLLSQTKVLASSQEALGTFRFSEFSLQPRLHIEEVGKGSFDIFQTWLGFEWLKDDSIRGHIWLGSSDLLTTPIWYEQKVKPDFGIVEAYLEGKHIYGDVRAGLINVMQGFEGVNPEWSWVLPQTQMRRLGWFVKRDYGFQVRWQYAPYSSGLAIHNGEAGPNLDGKPWYSGYWQWKNNLGVGLLATASTGQTKPTSTAASSAGNGTHKFEFNSGIDSKFRYGTFAVFREDERTLFLVEALKGEILQDGTKSPYSGAHLDISWNLGGDLSLLLRHEVYQSDSNDIESIKKSSSLGAAVTSKDRLQSVMFLATKHNEEPSNYNDEFFVIIRLNSRYLN